MWPSYVLLLLRSGCTPADEPSKNRRLVRTREPGRNDLKRPQLFSKLVARPTLHTFGRANVHTGSLPYLFTYTLIHVCMYIGLHRYPSTRPAFQASERQFIWLSVVICRLWDSFIQKVA